MTSLTFPRGVCRQPACLAAFHPNEAPKAQVQAFHEAIFMDVCSFFSAFRTRQDKTAFRKRC